MLRDLRSAGPAPTAAQRGGWQRAGRLWHACVRRPGAQRLQGRPVELRIGVRTAPGQLMAHAWVKHEGVALDGDPDTARQVASIEPMAR